MTKEKLKQELLFACMQNPALVQTEPDKDGVCRNRKAICTALETADEIIENWAEDFCID